jgi:hypothetical protein
VNAKIYSRNSTLAEMFVDIKLGMFNKIDKGDQIRHRKYQFTLFVEGKIF